MKEALQDNDSADGKDDIESDALIPSVCLRLGKSSVPNRSQLSSLVLLTSKTTRIQVGVEYTLQFI